MAKKENIENTLEPEKVDESNESVISEIEIEVEKQKVEEVSNPVYLVTLIEGNSYSFGSKKKKFVKGVAEKVVDPVDVSKLQTNGRFKVEKA